MYQVGDLVRYVPYNNEHPGSWIMYGGIGIIVSILPDKYSEIRVYKIKWLESLEESLLPGDFLEILEI